MFSRLWGLEDDKLREALKGFKESMDKIVKEKQAEMADKFMVGDEVSWNGAAGKVTSVTSVVKPCRPVQVRFDGCDISAYFCEDGKYCSWHRDASLILIARAKKKIKRTYWFSTKSSWLINGARIPTLLHINKLTAEADNICGTLHSIEIEEEE